MQEQVTRTYNLPTGELTLQLPARITPEDYFHVEARKNPKRGFLFVSTLLGKHLPVSLGRLRKIHAKLAGQIMPAANRPLEPTLVIGMAETATLLGYGVWRMLDGAFEDRDETVPTYYLQTTRYRLDQPAWAFEESHSHAPSQWLHGLDDPRLAQVKRVVLVDDELSTGRTFHALEAVIRAQLPQVAAVDWVCLTDFRPEAHQDHPASALLQGEWAWRWTHQPDPVTGAEGQRVDPSQLRADFGRAAPLDRARRGQMVEQTQAWLDHITVQGNVLMLGTGEYMALPFELAEMIARRPDVQGVVFQATTRSPAMMPKVELGLDHYGEEVNQYLYNYQRDHYDSVVLAVETPANDRTQALGQILDAQVVSPFYQEPNT